MFIQTEDTPNPQTMKFLPSMQIVEEPLDIQSAQEAAASPLAVALFDVKGVQSVFLGTDFISVTKTEDQEWQVMRPEILGVIMDHFAGNKPVLSQEGKDAATKTTAPVKTAEGDDKIVAQIIELLDMRIRPAVAQDGGDVAFEGYEDGIVYLRLKGACAGCPSATATLKFGIEKMLCHFIPEVQEVKQVL